MAIYSAAKVSDFVRIIGFLTNLQPFQPCSAPFFMEHDEKKYSKFDMKTIVGMPGVILNLALTELSHFRIIHWASKKKIYQMCVGGHPSRSTSRWP